MIMYVLYHCMLHFICHVPVLVRAAVNHLRTVSPVFNLPLKVWTVPVLCPALFNLTLGLQNPNELTPVPVMTPPVILKPSPD